MEKPDYVGHRRRLRERFDKAGSDGMSGYELLELLLSYAVPRRDVKPAAKRLLKKFGSVAGVIDADASELCSVDGIGERSATLVRLIKEFTFIYLAEGMRDYDYLKSPDAVIDFARSRIAGLKDEVFMVIYLNSKNGVNGYDIAAEGTIDRAAVFPRKIIEAAFTHKANGIILVHNHPSGVCTPTDEDKDITRSIVRAANAMDIRVVDHLVVGQSGHFSFVENNLL